jgi:hypothetical protein
MDLELTQYTKYKQHTQREREREREVKKRTRKKKTTFPIEHDIF